AQLALPSLRTALTALQLPPGADLSIPARSEAFRARDAVANAIQKIAPDQPKPLFTLVDMTSILNTLKDEATTQGDPGRRENVLNAVGPVWQLMNDQGLACTPDQMRQVLSAVKQTDPSAYAVVLTQVMKIDPRFVTHSTP